MPKEERKDRNEPVQCPSHDCAHWVALYHTGRLTLSDQSALRIWMQLSHANRRAYLKTDVIWRLAGGLAADPKIRNEVRRLRQRLPRQERRQVVP